MISAKILTLLEVKSPIKLRIYDIKSGQTLGYMSTSDFKKYCKSNFSFLEDLVKRFNSEKEKAGEPERVEIVIDK